MKFIEFQLGCRDCLSTDGINRIFGIPLEDSISLQKKTEFGVVNYLMENVNWNLTYCPNCNSRNVEFSEVVVDGMVMYDFDELARYCSRNTELMFMININKEDDELELETGGSQHMLDKDSVMEFIKYISNRTEEFFAGKLSKKSNGSFFCCLTTRYKPSTGKTYMVLQKLTCHGIGLDEVLDMIRKLKAQLENA
jgi:hypothetical protein